MARMGTRASCANTLKLEKAEALATLVATSLAAKSPRVIFKCVPLEMDFCANLQDATVARACNAPKRLLRDRQAGVIRRAGLKDEGWSVREIECLKAKLKIALSIYVEVPGLPDSAERNAFVNTSATDSGESTSALNFVTGLQMLTESVVW